MDYVPFLAFQLNCPAAMDIIKEGRPITIRDDKGNTSKCIADIVSVSVIHSTVDLCFSVIF